MSQLSKRESEMAELLAWGASQKEIAAKLFVSTHTVSNTARNIYAKLGINNVAQLSAWWFCTKYKISQALNPLAKAAATLFLIFLMVSNEVANDDDRVMRTARTSRSVKPRGPKVRRKSTDKHQLC